MSKRDEILSALAEIQFLSSPAMGALDVMNNPDATPAQISRELEVDPALTLSILRFANSSYFGCASQVHTVRDAVVRLGVATISRMLFLSSARQFSTRPVLGYGLPAGSLWNNMVSTAVASDLLAKTLQIEAPHYTFTAGLLHNIGKLVLGTYLEVDCAPILQQVEQDNISFDQAERQILGIDHAEVGATLLRQWSVPEEIVDVVRWYLDPEQCPGDKVAVDLVHVAHALSLMAGTGLGIDGLCYNLCKSSERRLGVSVGTVELILSELHDGTAQLAQTDSSEEGTWTEYDE